MKHQNSSLVDIVNNSRKSQERLDADTVLILGFLSLVSFAVAFVLFRIPDLHNIVKWVLSTVFLCAGATGILHAIRVYNFKRI